MNCLLSSQHSTHNATNSSVPRELFLINLLFLTLLYSSPNIIHTFGLGVCQLRSKHSLDTRHSLRKREKEREVIEDEGDEGKILMRQVRGQGTEEEGVINNMTSRKVIIHKNGKDKRNTSSAKEDTNLVMERVDTLVLIDIQNWMRQ